MEAMTARLAAAALLLLAGTLRAARCCPGPSTGPGPEPGPAPPPAAATGAPPAALGALLRALQRPGRSPAFLFQPQRFGRAGALARRSPRSWDPPAAPFWTMATPQRFGRRR